MSSVPPVTRRQRWCLPFELRTRSLAVAWEGAVGAGQEVMPAGAHALLLLALVGVSSQSPVAMFAPASVWASEVLR